MPHPPNFPRQLFPRTDGSAIIDALCKNIRRSNDRALVLATEALVRALNDLVPLEKANPYGLVSPFDVLYALTLTGARIDRLRKQYSDPNFPNSLSAIFSQADIHWKPARKAIGQNFDY